MVDAYIDNDDGMQRRPARSRSPRLLGAKPTSHRPRFRSLPGLDDTASAGRLELSPIERSSASFSPHFLPLRVHLGARSITKGTASAVPFGLSGHMARPSTQSSITQGVARL